MSAARAAAPGSGAGDDGGFESIVESGGGAALLPCVLGEAEPEGGGGADAKTSCGVELVMVALSFVLQKIHDLHEHAEQ